MTEDYSTLKNLPFREISGHDIHLRAYDLTMHLAKKSFNMRLDEDSTIESLRENNPYIEFVYVGMLLEGYVNNCIVVDSKDEEEYYFRRSEFFPYYTSLNNIAILNLYKELDDPEIASKLIYGVSKTQMSSNDEYSNNLKLKIRRNFEYLAIFSPQKVINIYLESNIEEVISECLIDQFRY